MRANEVAGRLARDAEGVARHLLPEGKRLGREWVCGDIEGNQGKSLKICLCGEKAGFWRDFSTGQSGDLLNLWAEVRKVSIADAMQEAKSFLGVHDPQIGRDTLLPRLNIPKEKPSGPALSFLQSRGLSQSIGAYNVRAAGNCVVFPSEVDETVRFAKCRDIEDKAKMHCIKGGKPVLFGWQAINERAREVVICEGELDAMAWYDMGYPALSVPNGAQSHSWVEVEYDRLERFDRIYIAFDADQPGQEGAKALLSRLGSDRCQLVDTSPFKDANEMLLKGGSAVAAITSARWLDPEELKHAGEYTDAVRRMLGTGVDAGPGFDPPWGKLKGKLRFRESELTVVNGVNGHGKSQLAGQIVLSALEQGWRTCKASLEMKPDVLLYRMARQANAGSVTSDAVERLGKWYQDKLWLFDLVGTAKAERLLEVFTYARKRYDCRLFVIDSLLKCGIAEDDYNGQKLFVESLCDFKNQYDAHIILVTHSRKGQSEDKPIGKMDVRGTGAITDLADTVIGVWRNKVKERKIAEKGPASSPEKLKAELDALLMIEKQRNGDWEGRAQLWLDRASNQFTSAQGEHPRLYGK